MDRREWLGSWRGLLALFGAALAWPPLHLLLKGSRATGAAAPAWADLGFASRIEEGGWQRREVRLETQDRWRRETRDELVYVRRKGGELQAVTAVCPHSGCLVKPDAAGFACPCHRSLFDADGRPLAGPSPRPLDRLELKLERGRALVRYRRFRPGSEKSEPLEG